MSSYIRIRLSKVPTSLQQEVVELAFKSGSSGASEALNFVQKNLAYDPDLLPSKICEFDVFFQERPECGFFDGLTDLNNGISWHIYEEESKDWLEEWKKGFVPFCLVGPYWVVPSWIEAPVEAKIPLKIDPGMAFGTGTHATTQLAASLVYKIVSKESQKNPKLSLIDVGTGTAILAMLAKKSGADLVVGIEIDPEARRVARENVERNELSEIMVFDETLDLIRDAFDVVVANIIDGVLLQLKKDLLRVLKPGGYLILTGVLAEREEYFIDQFLKDNPPVQIERRLCKDEWVGFLMKSTL